MHDDKPDQFVDELLDASLKRFGGEEPRAGLEMRVLAGVRSRQGAARRRRLVWALAACAGILAAIVLVVHSAHAPNRRPVTSASGAHRAPLQAATTAASPGSADSRIRSPRLVQGPREKPRTPKPAVRATKPSRPEQFPTPMPLTEQEKLLLTYFANTTKPDLLVETNKAEGAAEISNIKVAPLEIEPLDDSESGQGK
jgi:hypothetical protein